MLWIISRVQEEGRGRVVLGLGVMKKTKELGRARERGEGADVGRDGVLSGGDVWDGIMAQRRLLAISLHPPGRVVILIPWLPYRRRQLPSKLVVPHCAQKVLGADRHRSPGPAGGACGSATCAKLVGLNSGERFLTSWRDS